MLHPVRNSAAEIKTPQKLIEASLFNPCPPPYTRKFLRNPHASNAISPRLEIPILLRQKRLAVDPNVYKRNEVSFWKRLALNAISRRVNVLNRSTPNRSTAKLPRTEPYTIARFSVSSFTLPALAR